MKIGVLGTGMVGRAIASRLAALGHDVMMGSRTSNNPKATAWAREAGTRGHAGTFADSAAFGEMVFNCTNGANAVEALSAAGTDNLEGKIVVDVANLLPPQARGAESLGEQIQKVFPLAKVVKTLNTINCELMVAPQKLAASHTVFLSGNDADAKRAVRALLESFGWQDILDLGDITTARATETYLPLWLAASKTLGTATFNIKVVR
jgi:predicted dinucleotide-binding enzyme